MPYLISLVLIIIGSVGYYYVQHSSTDSLANNPAVSQEVVATSTLEDSTTQQPTIIPAPGDTSPSNQAPQEVPPSTPTPPKPDPTPIPTPPPGPRAAYKNGTYNSSVTYRVPSGRSYTIDVALTLSNDIVTASNLHFDSLGVNDGNTQNFVSAYKSYVVGQTLNQISLSRVGGSSITSRSFNQAVEAIKKQAS